MRKDLPSGFWVTCRHLPLNTTDREIRQAFYDAGVHIHLDHISVDNSCHHQYASVMVCVPKSALLNLLQRAMLEQETGNPLKLHGRELVPIMPSIAMTNRGIPSEQ